MHRAARCRAVFPSSFWALILSRPRQGGFSKYHDTRYPLAQGGKVTKFGLESDRIRWACRETAHMNDLCQLFDFHGRFSSIRSFYWPCTRFVRRKQNICLVFINTPPKELMDGHVILTRHGLRVAVRFAVGEGEREGSSSRSFSLY